jgi:hypothetical protein
MCVSIRHSMLPALRHSMPGARTRSVESARFAIGDPTVAHGLYDIRRE